MRYRCSVWGLEFFEWWFCLSSMWMFVPPRADCRGSGQEKSSEVTRRSWNSWRNSWERFGLPNVRIFSWVVWRKSLMKKHHMFSDIPSRFSSYPITCLIILLPGDISLYLVISYHIIYTSISHHISWYSIISRDISFYLVLSHYISLYSYLIIPGEISYCLMMPCDITLTAASCWYLVISHQI